jgi:hypothetical protein
MLPAIFGSQLSPRGVDLISGIASTLSDVAWHVASLIGDTSMSLRNSGLITFLPTAPKPGWATDGQGYDLDPSPVEDGVQITASKHPDGSLEIRVADQSEHIIFNHPPGTAIANLSIAVSWNAGTVDLYLNGIQTDSVTLLPVP